MSLLSSTQGTPERVRSLSNLLVSLGEAQDAAQLERLLAPRGLVGESIGSVLSHSLNVAKDLRLIRTVEGGRYAPEDGIGPMDEDAFADHAHDVLCSTEDLNTIVLQSFCYLLLRSDRERGADWIRNMNRDGIANAIDAGLPRHTETEQGKRQVNGTKLTVLMRWWSYLGLCTSSIPGIYVYPDPSDRLSRVVKRSLTTGVLEAGVQTDPREFRRVVCEAAPYLDSGSMSSSVQISSGLELDEQSASWALTTGVEQLEFDGTLEIVASSDASGGLRMAFPVGARGTNYADHIVIQKG